MLGKWTGTYQYVGKRINKVRQNRITQFEIEIIEFEGIHFSGKVQDDLATGGTPGIGKITGKIKDNKISFIKEMPVQAIILKDGTRMEEDKPHRKIYYTGILEKGEIKGKWKFKFGFGKVHNQWVIFAGTRGIWQMKRP